MTKRGDWAEFHGKILGETPEHIDLIATDGGQGVVRVFKGAYRVVRKKVEVLIGGQAQIIRQPKV